MHVFFSLEATEDMYTKNRELTFSTQPLQKPLLQATYASSSHSLPDGYYTPLYLLIRERKFGLDMDVVAYWNT